MTHIKENAEKIVQKTDVQDPVSKIESPVCPPAPIKSNLSQNSQGPQKASLRKYQALEFRKSWKTLREVFKE